ncbi:MAG: gliding motility protein GldL [Bacteroidaceae bacterium]|nr:gliding motility protein GldL [Bacteroidaceae bacterium]
MARQYTGIQKWLRTKGGQTFLNYAYSWGASVVIAGALFKLTHIAGADIMLFLGMGTEVIVFFLAGFEPQESMDAQELAEEAAENAAITAQVSASLSDEAAAALANAATTASRMPIGGGGTVVIGGGSSVIDGQGEMSGEPEDAAQLAESISAAPVFSSAQFQGMTPEMQEATSAYVEQLTDLTDTLKKVAEQSARLTRDSEEMENMNRTLTGINRFYEMQLKSVGTQSATIDEVNEQTKKLAVQLQELNEVYAKMVEALKMKIS